MSLVKNKRNQAKPGVVTSDGSGKHRRSEIMQGTDSYRSEPDYKSLTKNITVILGSGETHDF